MDILFLKYDLYADISQLSDRFQQLGRVSGEARYALCIDLIELMIPCILHHQKELRALLNTVTADSFIRVDAGEVYLRVILERTPPVVLLEIVAV